MNLNDSDIEVITLVEKVKVVRSGLGMQIRHLRERYEKIRKMEMRKRKMGELLEYMQAMRELH